MNDRIISALESGADMVVMVTATQLRDFAEYVMERQREQAARESLAEREELRPLEYWADKLNVNRSTLWRWEKQGRIQSTHIGGKVYYKASDFDTKD